MKNQRQSNGMTIDPALLTYMRYHPEWYLLLSRYPEEYPQLLERYKIENKLTMADRIERVGTLMKMIEMFI